MFRASLMFLAGAITAVIGQSGNQGDQPTKGDGVVPGQEAMQVMPHINSFEPLVFVPEDCDLNDDGKVDKEDLIAVDQRNESYKEFKTLLIKQLQRSAERRGVMLPVIPDLVYDKFARALVSANTAERLRQHNLTDHYHLLLDWDMSEQCHISWNVLDKEMFEQVRKGKVLYHLDPFQQRWERVSNPIKPVIVRLRPGNV